MKIQTLGILLTFLLSSYGHETVNHQRNIKSNHDNFLFSPSSEVRKDVRSSETVARTLNLVLNKTTNLGSIVNVTAEVAIVFDNINYHTSIFWGSSSDVIIINLQNEVGVYISSSNLSWNARTTSFEDYFKQLVSLKALYENSPNCRENFTVDNITSEISSLIRLGVIDTSQGEYSISQNEALAFFINYSNILIKAYKGPLNGIMESMGFETSSVHSFRTTSVFFGQLGEVVSKMKGGVAALNSLHIDWKFVNYQQSSIKIFIHIFDKMYQHGIDVRKILRDYANNFAEFLARFEGDSAPGVSGVLRIIGKIRSLMLKKCAINDLTKTLLEYFLHKKDNDLSLEELKTQLCTLINFIEKIGATNDLRGIVEVFREVIQEKHQLNHSINTYLIVTICLKSNADPIRSIVSIFVSLQKIVKIQISIAAFIYNLIGVVSEDSSDTIRTLIPEVRINCSVDIVLYIFRGAKIEDLDKGLLKFMKERPVLRNIIAKIECALNEYKIVLKVLFASKDFRKTGCLIMKKLEKIIREVNNKEGIKESNHLTRYSKRHNGFQKGQLWSIAKLSYTNEEEKKKAQDKELHEE